MFVLVVMVRELGPGVRLTVIPGFSSMGMATSAGNAIQDNFTRSGVEVTYCVVGQ